MDQALIAYIQKHSGMPLPELKLELMKQGFSSYQIEQALITVKARRMAFFRSFVVLLVVAAVFVVIGLVFISFIRPAEEFVKIPLEQESEQKWVALPSERPIAPEAPFEEEIEMPQKKEEFGGQIETEKQAPSKNIEEIRRLSNAEPSVALEQCKLIEARDECISLVAKNTNTPLFCEQIENTGVRDNCFFFFGQANDGFCARIISSAVRNSCYVIAGINEKI